MTIVHHETLSYHQQRENFLVQSLSECSEALEKALILIRREHGVNSVPTDLSSIAAKYKEMIKQIKAHSS